MQIKTIPQERAKMNISEWNEETPAYIRPLNGFEQLVFNDYFIVFFSESRPYEKRYEAGFKAAKMALVGEDNAPLLTDDDKDVIKNASVFRSLDCLIPYSVASRILTRLKKTS